MSYTVVVTLEPHLSETAVACNGVLDGVPVDTKPRRTPTSYSYWWRWDSEPDMAWQHLITGSGELAVPFDAQGRKVRLSQIAYAGGRPSDALIAEGAQTVIDTSSGEAIRHLWVFFDDVSNETFIRSTRASVSDRLSLGVTPAAAIRTASFADTPTASKEIPGHIRPFDFCELCHQITPIAFPIIGTTNPINSIATNSQNSCCRNNSWSDCIFERAASTI